MTKYLLPAIYLDSFFFNSGNGGNGELTFKSYLGGGVLLKTKWSADNLTVPVMC